jgi:hypothetical protein
LILASCSPRGYQSTDYVRIDAHPFGPPEEDRDEFFREIRDIQTDGEAIFLSTNSTGLIELDQDGNKVRVFGEIGQGPAFISRVLGSTVTPDLVWLLDGRAGLHCYERDTGLYLYSARLDIPRGAFLQIYARRAGSNPLVYREHQLLLPIFLGGAENSIAMLVDEQGQLVRHIDDPDYHQINENVMPGWRRTLWTYDGGYWYCVYMYRHRVLKLDENFNKIYDVKVENPSTETFDSWVGDSASIPPYYWDIDHSASSLYVLAQDGVDQIDKDTGRFICKIRFTHITDQIYQGKDVPQIYRGKPLPMLTTFTTLGVKKGGLVILSPNFPAELSGNLFQASLDDMPKGSER